MPNRISERYTSYQLVSAIALAVLALIALSTSAHAETAKSARKGAPVTTATHIAASTATSTAGDTAAAAKTTAASAIPSKPLMTIAQVLDTYGKAVRSKLKLALGSNNVPYPPTKMTWVGLKQEKILLIFAPDCNGKMRKILSYPIIGQSGGPGPKLKEGDKQVPEGFYKLVGFRPNVIAHLGLDVNYPNAQDRAHARTEKRSHLGGDIMIHGSRWSTGCLAMGNEPIEELFVLAYDSKLTNISLILSPCNLAAQAADIDFKKQPSWLPQLYAQLMKELKKYPI